MAMQAKDGTMHHSATRARMHDEKSGSYGSAKSAPAPKSSAAPMGDGDVSKMPISKVVAAHGPATSIEMSHDEGTGTHHVHSTHKGKHHHSDHETKEAAHEHAAQAAGIDNDSEDEQDGGEEQSPDNTSDDENSGGSSIPGMI